MIEVTRPSVTPPQEVEGCVCCLHFLSQKPEAESFAGAKVGASSLDAGLKQRGAQEWLAVGLTEYQRQKYMFKKN